MSPLIPAIRELWQRGAERVSEQQARLRGGRAVGATASGCATELEHDSQDGQEGHGGKGRRTPRTYAREAAALVLIASGLYGALALASYQADPLRPEVIGPNWVGPVGEAFARRMVQLIGVVAWLLPLEILLVARPLLLDRQLRFSLTRLSGDILVGVVAAALTHIALPSMTAFGAMPLGGDVGNLFGEVLRGLFSTAGSFLIGLTVIGLILVERATFSFIEQAQRLQQWLLSLRARTRNGVGAVGDAWVKARSAEQARRQQERLDEEPKIATAEQADEIIAAFADDGDGRLPVFVRPRVAPANAPLERVERTSVAAETSSTPIPDDAVPTPSPLMPVAEKRARTKPTKPRKAKKAPVTPVMVEESEPVIVDTISGELVEEAEAESAAEEDAEHDAAVSERPLRATGKRKGVRRRRSKPVEEEPQIVDTSQAAKTTKAKGHQKARSEESRFKLPPPALLDPKIVDQLAERPEKLKETARQLEKTLRDYGVEGRVQEIHPGPTVTLFEVSPAAGTKVSKVAGLADDLALGLSRKVRIIAPIPGKNRIGFEVPNDHRVAVSLRELVESKAFMELDVPLPVVLGRDLVGRPYFADLSKMPHVIVAGATGAGKSVGLNVMLISLLCRRTPDELRMLMIDPKVVELAPFDRIPHLLFPVVTDMKQASNALKWAVDEMERRYQLFADAGTRNVESYNGWVKRVRNGELPMPIPSTVEATAPDGTQLEIPATKDGSDAEMPIKLPYIVVVVEEFADLMMTQGKDVEASVARLAQKARAAGLHVILATQRPSVDVITGMIKANFPTRIAYRVAQKVDSRTILDQQGAEHLLGRGDMLVKLNGTNDVQRVQCPFASEEEVQRITDMLREQGEPEYDESIVQRADDGEGVAGGDAETDALYDQAIQIVAETKKCSTSWIQRKLGIGYNRAAKIVEAMEQHGVVGPPNGSKPREILISCH